VRGTADGVAGAVLNRGHKSTPVRVLSSLKHSWKMHTVLFVLPNAARTRCLKYTGI